MGTWFKALRGLTWLVQLGISTVMPLLLCILGARWLQSRLGWGGWIMALGIVLGIGGTVSSLWSCLKQMRREAGQEDPKSQGPSFNDHL